MKEISVSTHIGASPARVFATCSDFANAPQTISAIKKVEMLTPGPVGKGTKFRETRVMFGKEVTETLEVVEFDPGRSYVVGSDSCGCRYRCTFSFRQNGNGTDVECRFSAIPLTFGARIMGAIMAPFMSGMMRKCLVKDLEEIKAKVESGR